MAAPVVLLHGWGGSFSSTFAASGWVERFEAAGRKVLPLGLPGHGDRDASQDPAAYADLTASLAERLPAGRADVVGFSLGAKLALSLALRFPDRVGALALGGVGDNVFAPEPDAEALALALEAGSTEATPGAVAALVRYSWIAGAHPKALAAVLRRPPNPVLTAEGLARLQGPILLVNGDGDAVAMPDGRLRAALPALSYRRAAGVDHLSLPDRLAFQGAAVAFLQGQRAAPVLERLEP